MWSLCIYLLPDMGGNGKNKILFYSAESDSSSSADEFIVN
jgi:hypothetical protein